MRIVLGAIYVLTQLAAATRVMAVDSIFPDLGRIRSEFLGQDSQQERQKPADQPPLLEGESKSSVVRVYVSVNTSKDLKIGDFRIEEKARNAPDYLPQKILYLGHTIDEPMTVGILIDNSGSFLRNRAPLLQAAKYFCEHRNPGERFQKPDEIFPVLFDDKYHLFKRPDDEDDSASDSAKMPFIRNEKDCDAFVRRLQPRGGTVLYKTIFAAADYALAHGTLNKRALVILSDGDDQGSDTTTTDEEGNEIGPISMEEALQEAWKANIQIYSLSISNAFLAPDNRGGRNLVNDKESRKNLSELAAETGGVVVPLKSPLEKATKEEVEKACDKLYAAMRDQYVLAFSPEGNPKESELRDLLVTATNSRGGDLNPRYQKFYRVPPR